jgi:CRISPR-associated endonuclease/helicase Cas3
MTLTPEDFTPFYQQVHGDPPFPWQADLARQVLAERSWPQLIDVPTGMGKTALLDIAVFIAAATSREAGAHRLGRRRIFFVVDRRIVVDEAYDRAVLLSKALERALESEQDTAVRRVALGLQALAPAADRGMTLAPDGGEAAERRPRTVLPVTRMRGGVTWDSSWLDRPDLPGIVVGTVDQVGSRLLFRGYGVSDRRKPVDAALVGTDSLILVDEAHLAEVMVSTITEAHRRDVEGLGLPQTDVVRMTATAGEDRLRRYSLNVEAHRDNDVAWRRLHASKRLSLVSSDVKLVVPTMADEAIGLLTTEHKTILVVCNTVDRARQVHATLTRAATRQQIPLDADVTLLIGRSRPADRDLLVGRLKERFGVGRARTVGTKPAILVATQTVEVGANLDADGLVSESAPWDSLVQRLGRVNRLGECPGTARAIVVHDGVDDGPVYGRARDVTWDFLFEITNQGAVDVDVSPLACRDLSGNSPHGASAERSVAPLLTSPILDCWVRTGPVPMPDVPVAPYLHGLGTDFATVSIAWRDGLVDPDPMGDDAERPEEDVNADLSAMPVRSEELVEVPLHAVRRWLRGESALPLTDLDADTDPQLPVRRVRDDFSDDFRAMVWRNDPAVDNTRPNGRKPRPTGSWVWIDARGIRPGDVLVIPTERGGLDEYGWAPDSDRPVLDVAEAVRARPDLLGVVAFGRALPLALLRIDERTAGRLGLGSEDSRELRRLTRELGKDFEDREGSSPEQELPAHLAASIQRVLESIGGLPSDERLPGTAWTPAALVVLKSWVSSDVTVVAVLDRQGHGSDRFILAPGPKVARIVERDDELPESSSMSARQVTLRTHHTNVGDRAREIAQALGLDSQVSSAVETAARWHDLGKVEPRFQAMLCGGDEYEAMLVDEPLAKSGMNPADRTAYRVARQRSGLPQGTRHEAWSAALVGEHLAEAADSYSFDPDLVIHLVASHHGYARPWLPPVMDGQPRDVEVLLTDSTTDPTGTKVSVSSRATIDFDHPARFARLNERYGRWGLALLESIVRCADMTVSGEGS